MSSASLANPWPTLTQGSPFVLAGDLAAVSEFNSTAPDNYILRTGLLPEPYVGRVGAPVVLLALNPGCSHGDIACHADPEFRERVRTCHRQDDVEWPYYYLAPDASGPGAEWSRRVLGHLIREVGLLTVARNVVMYEYVAYHSVSYSHRTPSLPSQEFTFESVRNALGGSTVVFVTRGWKEWVQRIPEIAASSKVFRTRSAQNIVITPRNSPEGWDAAIEALRT